MESKAIPTPEEYLDLFAVKQGHRNALAMAMYLPLLESVNHVKIAMHEYAVLFAQHHVEQAKKDIYTKVISDIEKSSGDMLVYVNKKLLANAAYSILGAYQPEMIK
jgi:hypothetical protein